MSNNNPQQPPQLPTGHLDIRPELRGVQQRQQMSMHQNQMRPSQFQPQQPQYPGHDSSMVPSPMQQFHPQSQQQQSRMPQPMDYQMNRATTASSNFPPQPPPNMYPMGSQEQQQAYSKQYPPSLHPSSGGGGPPISRGDPGMQQQDYLKHQQQQFQQHQLQQQHSQVELPHHQQHQHQQPSSSMFPQPPSSSSQQQLPPPPPSQPIELQMYQPNPNLPSHLSKVPIEFPGPGPGPDAESTLKNEWNEKIMRLIPRPLFHPNLLENLSNKSVGFLCGVGKDIVQELAIRLVSLTNIFKIPNWKISAFAEVELILSYNKFLMEKIREIRAYVDRKTLNNQKLSTNDFIELMALPIPPKAPKHVEELRSTYKENEKFLLRVSNAFKKVEWLGENADPRNAALCLKDEVARITAVEEVRKQVSSTSIGQKKP